MHCKAIVRQITNLLHMFAVCVTLYIFLIGKIFCNNFIPIHQYSINSKFKPREQFKTGKKTVKNRAAKNIVIRIKFMRRTT